MLHMQVDVSIVGYAAGSWVMLAAYLLCLATAFVNTKLTTKSVRKMLDLVDGIYGGSSISMSSISDEDEAAVGDPPPSTSVSPRGTGSKRSVGRSVKGLRAAVGDIVSGSASAPSMHTRFSSHSQQQQSLTVKTHLHGASSTCSTCPSSAAASSTAPSTVGGRCRIRPSYSSRSWPLSDLDMPHLDFDSTMRDADARDIFRTFLSDKPDKRVHLAFLGPCPCQIHASISMC